MAIFVSRNPLTASYILVEQPQFPDPPFVEML